MYIANIKYWTNRIDAYWIKNGYIHKYMRPSESQAQKRHTRVCVRCLGWFAPLRVALFAFGAMRLMRHMFYIGLLRWCLYMNYICAMAIHMVRAIISNVYLFVCASLSVVRLVYLFVDDIFDVDWDYLCLFDDNGHVNICLLICVCVCVCAHPKRLTQSEEETRMSLVIWVT